MASAYDDLLAKLNGPAPKTEGDFINEVRKLFAYRQLAIDPDMSSARQEMLQLQALESWRRITDGLLDWVLYNYPDHLGESPTYVRSDRHSTDLQYQFEHRDRRTLQRRLCIASQNRQQSFSVVVLPTRIATTAGDALLKLEYGETPPFFEPATRKSSKDGYSVPRAQCDLVAAVRYLVGTGMTEIAARQKVSALSQGRVTTDKLRNWARKDLFDPTACGIAEVSGEIDAGITEEIVFNRLKGTVQEKHMEAWRWAYRAKSRIPPIDDTEILARIQRYRDAEDAQVASIARRKKLR